MTETMERKGSLRLNCDDEVISDETFETMLAALDDDANDKDVSELLQVMNENRIITREEAEQILEVGGPNTVVKCGLPPHVRPSDPENTTDAEECVSRILKNDPTMVEVNLNNMKRTPIPVIQRMLMALKTNTHLKKLMLANTGLSDTGAEPLLESLEENTTLECLNIETNFLSGDFLAKLFKAALNNQTLREIKAVNQSPTFSTESEMEIMKAVHSNRGLTKVSVNLRHPEAKNKIELACLRNGELKRQQRRLEQIMKQKEEAGEATSNSTVQQNNVEKTDGAAAPKKWTPAASQKKPVGEKPTAPASTAAKKEPLLKKTPVAETVSNASSRKERDIKPLEKPKQTEQEKVVEKKLVEFEKKAAAAATGDKDSGKKTPVAAEGKEKEKPAASKASAAAPPVPPPAPKLEDDVKKPSPWKPPEKTSSSGPKPTLAMAAKEAAAKAASRGFGTSDTGPVKKKLSIGERSKPKEDALRAALDASSSSSSSTKPKARPGSLNVSSSKDIPTSKGLGAATFGSTPKPPTPGGKSETTKGVGIGGRRGSASKTTPTPSTPTPKSEIGGVSGLSKSWGSGAGAKSSDVKSKIEALNKTDTKSKPVTTYGYGMGGKKRDSIK